jgi:serine protease Do
MPQGPAGPRAARLAIAALASLTLGLAPCARATPTPASAAADQTWSAGAPLTVEGRHPSRFTVAAPVLDDKVARQLGISGQDLRVWLIEQVRSEGWPISGAENPLFDQDQSEDARFVLGGEVTDLYDAIRERRDGTAVDVRWELLDRRTNEVVYKVVTRGWLAGAPAGEEARDWSLKLLRLALFNVLARERFLTALEAPFTGSSLPPSGVATLRACRARPAALPDGFDQVLPAVVSVRNGAATGSGVLVSPDGFVITAAEVVEGADVVEVALHQGPQLAAQVLQYDTAHDVALLQVQGSNFACAAVAATKPGVGQPVYLVGSPGASRGPSPRGTAQSTVSSGVVSGVRVVDDVELLQTDAATGSAAAGGPLLNTQGALVGVMSRRIAGSAASGGSFAIPAQAVERWLGLQFGERSDPFAPRGAAPAPVEAGPVVDAADPPVSPRDAEVCLFRRGGGPETAFDVASVPVTIGARQYACVPVPAGNVTINRAGALPTRYRLRTGDTLYLLVVGRSLSKSIKAELERAQGKGIQNVSP